MTEKITYQNITLQPLDNERLANLCGLLDENLRQIESYLDVQISNRGNSFRIKGDKINVPITSDLIEHLYEISATERLTPKQIHMYLSNSFDTEEVSKKIF